MKKTVTRAAVGLLVAALGAAHAGPKTPEQKAAEEARFQIDVLKIKAMREKMKNPASFQLLQAARMDSGALCVVYRATNGFNAVVTEQKAITVGGSLGEWNKLCAGKSGEDISYIRQAL